jgi:hypothetical protein
VEDFIIHKLVHDIKYIMNMAVSWDVASCSLLDIDRSFRGVSGPKMNTVSASETSANSNQTARRNIQERHDIFILAAVVILNFTKCTTYSLNSPND